MDLFDMSYESLQEIELGRQLRNEKKRKGQEEAVPPALCEVTPKAVSPKGKGAPRHISSLPSSLAPHFESLARGLTNLSNIPTLVMGAQSDALFPFVQQREIAEALRVNGNKSVVYYELDSPMGHDTFLLDVANVTAALRGFL